VGNGQLESGELLDQPGDGLLLSALSLARELIGRELLAASRILIGALFVGGIDLVAQQAVGLLARRTRLC
jgi:hypothetical protein